MLREEDIAIQLRCQQFICKSYMRDLDGEQSVLLFESERETKEVICPHCRGKVYADGYGHVTLKDMPVWYGMAQELTFVCHRFECRQCGKKFTEEVPMQHPGTKVTERAARWIQAMLRFKVSIRSIQSLTGIHWETIRNLHLEIMESTLEEHMAELKADGYRPRLLAVDEFAIHKGIPTRHASWTWKQEKSFGLAKDGAKKILNGSSQKQSRLSCRRSWPLPWT